MKNISILLASGSGTRMKSTVPKQFIKIQEREIWTYCARNFISHQSIEKIVFVTQEKYIIHMQKQLECLCPDKNFTIVKGAEERYLSAFNAIKSLEEDEQPKIIITDIVRPFISSQLIDNCLKKINKYDVLDVGIPLKETLFEVANNEIINIPNRENFVLGQGPETFRLWVLKKVIEKFEANPNFKPTNITGLVKRYLPEINIGFVEGENINIKVTTQEDLDHMKVILDNYIV